MERQLISLVIPCYNEQEMLPLLHEKLDEVVGKLENFDVEILMIDDGSKDDTLQEIKELAKKDERVKYIAFSRNFGKEAAMYAGLCHAKGDYVATLDADMQDPPDLLPDMLHYILNEGYDSVATRRVDRIGEPKIRSFCARSFYKLMNRVSEADIADGARDFRLMNRKMSDAVVSLGESNRFSKGIYGWVGFKTKWIPFQNVERAAGETKWSFWKLLGYALDGMVSFSNVPLQISSYMGLGMTFVSVIAIVFIIVRKIIFDNSAYGWASLVCIITLIAGIQLFCMGIMGQYLAKTYLEVKKRPIYIVDETNISENKETN